jgi:integrase/recombinase XerD
MSRPNPARDRLNRILTAPQNAMEQLQQEYLRSMILRNCSDRTIEYWGMNLGKFNRWCEERSIDDLDAITLEVLNAYRQHLFHCRNERTGKPLKFVTQHCYLIVIRRWFLWMYEKGRIKLNIAADLEIPKAEQRLPVNILTADEVESIMNETDVTRPMGIRDRAIMETFYSTAIRASELVHLQLYDLDADRKTVTVRQGKGKKDRVVPIGDRAIRWTQKYLSDVRPAWMATKEAHPYLFVTRHGARMLRGNLPMIIGRYKEKAGIKKPGSCHLLRHTAATLMMQNGADLRSLQLYLGHARLTTTQIYTHVTIERLHAVHAKTHPASEEPPADGSNTDGES